MVNNLRSYSQHFAEFLLLSIGIGSIPTLIDFKCVNFFRLKGKLSYYNVSSIYK